MNGQQPKESVFRGLAVRWYRSVAVLTDGARMTAVLTSEASI